MSFIYEQINDINLLHENFMNKDENYDMIETQPIVVSIHINHFKWIIFHMQFHKCISSRKIVIECLDMETLGDLWWVRDIQTMVYESKRRGSQINESYWKYNFWINMKRIMMIEWTCFEEAR